MKKSTLKVSLLMLLLTQFLLGHELFGQSDGSGNCISGPLEVYVGESANYYSDNWAQCTRCYDWDISGPGYINGTDEEHSVNIQFTDEGYVDLCLRVFSDSIGCDSCCITILVKDSIPDSLYCCFEFWITPRGSNDSCFVNCYDSLDNGFTFHHRHCDDFYHYTTAITDFNIIGSGITIGNCYDCSRPISSTEGPLKTIDFAFCGVGSFTYFNFDISFYDEYGNLVYVCENYNYFPRINTCDPQEVNESLGTAEKGVLQKMVNNDRYVNIFPNPTDDYLTIESEKDISRYSLYDIEGKEGVINQLYKSNSIDLSSVTTGVYLLHLEFTDGSTVTRKIIKK